MAQRKKAVGIGAVTLAISNNIKGLPVEPRRPSSQVRASHARTIDINARRAVLAFLGVMSDEIGAETLAFSRWSAAYDDLRPEREWPPLKDKVLALALQQAGCRRKSIDARSKGRGRYVAYQMPMEMAA